jgi:hypothetical protein
LTATSANKTVAVQNLPAPGSPDGTHASTVLNTDIVIENTTVKLRAERVCQAPGRVYTITARSKDLAGNVAAASVKCTVPHDQGKN